MPPLCLLGPQRTDPNLPAVLERLGVDGPIVAITAGWRHDEGELDALTDAVGPVVHLPLYRWFDKTPTKAPEIAAMYRERQQRIQRFKELYRLRVHAALGSVRQLLGLLPTDPELVALQIDRATEVVRGIDDEALQAVDDVRSAYTGLHARFEVDWVRERRDEAADAIGRAGAVLIAGGHVAVLRNRMLFFGVEHALAARSAPLLAWGAGAMVCTERIVLFYDDAPDGPSEAEILDHGLGFAPDLVCFPHAHERLRLEDTNRVAALSRRFGPSTCLALETGAWVERDEAGWFRHSGPESAFLLGADGGLHPLEVR